MSFEAYTIEPKEIKRPDTLGFYALTIGATMSNTADRIKAMVDRVGFPFVISDLIPQNKKTIFGMDTRAANQPSGNVYRDMSLRRAEFVAQQAEKHNPKTHLAMGDSLGVPVVQGMQLHAADIANFDALLLRDGWNLKRGGGIPRFIGYTVRNTIHDQIHQVQFDIPKTPLSDMEPMSPDETGGLEKLKNVSDLMRGPENRQNAIALAAGDVAMNVVCLDHGLSGSLADQSAFVYEMLVTRWENTPLSADARIRAEVAEGWHSTLMDPVRGAEDVTNTLALL